MLGSILMGGCSHEIVRFSFLAFQGWSNIDDHSGYEFPWMFTKIFPWSASNVFHNYHHLINIGNYSAHMIWWDSIFETSVEFIDHFEDMKQGKADENDITKIKRH